MKVYEVIDFIDKTAPLTLAEEWDSPGLKTGSLNDTIDKILLCLDVSVEVVKEAIDKGCNLIISHHPVMFRPISSILYDNEAALCLAIKNDISIYSAHTNLDFAPKGINDTLAQAIGLIDIQKDFSGKHAYGYTTKEISLNDFIKQLKEKLKVPFVNVTMPSESYKDITIKKVGVSSGGFDGETKWAIDLGIQVLVTGEIKHAEFISLKNKSIIVIGAGHYYTEIPGMEALKDRLNDNGFYSILSNKEKNPFEFY